MAISQADYDSYFKSLTGQKMTLQQLKDLGFMVGGRDQNTLGRQVGERFYAPNAGQESSTYGQSWGMVQDDPNGAWRADTANGFALDENGNVYKTLTADDVRATGVTSQSGSFGLGNGTYGQYNYGLMPNDDGTYTLGDGAFRELSAHQVGDTFFDRYAPLAAGAAITGGALGLFGAGGAPAASALGMGADGMGAMALGSGGGAAGAAGLAGGANAFGESGTLLSNELPAAGWNSEIGLSGASGDFGVASGVAAPAGYTGAMQTMAGTGGAGAAAGAGLGSTAANTAATGGLGSQVLSALNSPLGVLGAGAALGAIAGGQDSTTTNSTQVDPALAAYMQQYRDLAAQTAGIPFEAYTGQRVAGLSPEQQSAGAALQSQVDSIPGMRDQIGGLIGQGTTNLSATQNAEMDQIRSMLSGLTEAKTAAANPYAAQDNPYLQAAIAAANRGLVDSYNTVVAPKYSQGSSFGNSGLAEYEALDRANLARQLSDNSNTLSYQGYNLGAQLAESGAARQDALTTLAQQLGLQGSQLLSQLGESQAGRADQMATGNATRQLQGAQILGNSEQQFASLMNNLLGYGNTVQATNQAGLDAQYEEFLRRIQYPQQQLGIFGQGLAANPGSTSTSTTPGNAWTGAAGGALLGAQVNRLLNQPTNTGSTQQQVINSPSFSSTMGGSLDLTNPKKLFGQTVVGQ